MIGVLIVPTGIGAEIGGHAGDANPVAKLMAGCFDKLITHPNMVNASDVNEMTDNTLYVEGSILDRFLSGDIKLREVYQNKILVVTNKPCKNETINAVSSARATIGINAEILELDTPLIMQARIEKCATGDVTGWSELVEQVRDYNFDALAIHTPIQVDRKVALNYYRNGGINPWGAVEALASKLIATELNKPVAHAPLDENLDEELFNMFQTVVDPRIAPEAISICYLHCVLKGLNRAPRISAFGISKEDVSFLISPDCWGTPHALCYKVGIPTIIVKENRTVGNKAIIRDEVDEKIIIVENYWEAVGIIMSLKAGISPESVRRPLGYINVVRST